jgi:hypothetical protein
VSQPCAYLPRRTRTRASHNMLSPRKTWPYTSPCSHVAPIISRPRLPATGILSRLHATSAIAPYIRHTSTHLHEQPALGSTSSAHPGSQERQGCPRFAQQSVLLTTSWSCHQFDSSKERSEEHVSREVSTVRLESCMEARNLPISPFPSRDLLAALQKAT